MARLLPLGILLLGLVLVAAPGALEGIEDQIAGKDQIGGESKVSVEGRVSDYAAVEPDILSHPVLGRGYGTYDPNVYETKEIPTRHRFLDNEYLARLLETGIIGVIAYLGLGVAGIAVLHRAARSKDFARAGPALALIGAIFAFTVCGALFNLMAFVQVPYLLFFMLGLTVIVATDEQPSVS
jgi:O-antigen ligase